MIFTLFGQKLSQMYCRLLLLVSLSIMGCVSARMSDSEADRLFRGGLYMEAAEHLKKGLLEQGENGRDQLLYLLDVGLSLHSAGKFEESNVAFLKADKIADIKDYTSLSAETASLISSENMTDYQGEDFEKVLINTYLAMNYALMGDVENALVEARRVNHKLHLMVSQGGRKYKQNAFARYLSAILYESEKNYNDAYIDYQQVYQLKPDYPGLGVDLWRCAWLMHMPDEMEKWDQKFHLTDEDHARVRLLVGNRQKSEIIVIYENGISPLKQPNPEFQSLPKFYPRFNPVRTAEVLMDGQSQGVTSILEDIEATAILNLDEKYGKMIAKRLAGQAVKGAIGYGVGKKTDDPMLGLLVYMLLDAADQADLRSWHLLPRDLQVLRVKVDPGLHRIQLLPQGAAPLAEKLVQVAPGKKVFVNFRYMP
jgi:hypothetical protein